MAFFEKRQKNSHRDELFMGSCAAYKKIARFRRLFIVFEVLTAAAVLFALLATLCVKTNHVCCVLHLICWLCEKPVSVLRLEGLKNVAATVGATGIFFVWLLQIMDTEVCGVRVDELIREQFKGYVLQLFAFILAVVVCIYYSSSFCQRDGKWHFIAFLTSVVMVCGVLNMWILCVCFLFSTPYRRTLAFCYLEEELKRYWSETKLDFWAGELNTCVDRGETDAIRAYFCTVRRKVSEERTDKNKQARLCCEIMEKMWEKVGQSRWDNLFQYLPCDGEDHDMEGMLLTSAFLLRGAAVQEDKAKRYKAVLDGLKRGTEGKTPIPGHLLALYLTFIAVHQSASNNEEIPRRVFNDLYLTRWDRLATPKSGMEYFQELLRMMIRCYNNTYTYPNPKLLEEKCELKDSLRFLERMPGTARAVAESKQKGDA